MQTLNDVHQQFAEYFDDPVLKPYLYTLSRKMSEGHVCIHTTAIDEETLPEPYKALTGKALTTGSHLLGSNGDYKPFILDGERLYLHRYFYYESRLIKAIAKLVNADKGLRKERVELLKGLRPLVQELFHSENAANTDWQLAAALISVLNNFTILTGGPGTGKTTTVAKILAILFSMQPDIKIALAAPTGKAGARMTESLLKAKINVGEEVMARFRSLKPATLHRLLGWQKANPYFKYNADNPMPHDLVVVDESSMIDMALFSKLLDALKPGARIILLGDKDQLTSVEAGSLFGDLCRSLPELNVFDDEHRDLINSFIVLDEAKVPVPTQPSFGRHLLSQHLVELKYSHRFKADKGIGKLSRAVINNDKAVLQQFIEEDSHDEVVIDQQYDQHIFESFVDGYKDYIGEKDIRLALEKMNNLRILCAVKQGPQGVFSLNAMAESWLIKSGSLKRDSEFYEHRPVMVMQNDYTLGLYNGDTGILRKDENGVMKAWFIDSAEGNSGNLKSVLPGFIPGIETVFAMTIHKSQGSEFGEVMVVLPRQTGFQLLTRELLYTGITRAKHKVIIQSDAETLLEATAAVVERGSGVVERLDEYGQ